MIQAILWDVDATLLDFHAAERTAILKLFRQFHLGECSDAMLQEYAKINRGYWERLEKGELTRDQVLVGRFQEFFEKEGLDVSAAPAFNEAYQQALGDTIVYCDDSYQIIDSLMGKGEAVCGIQRNDRCAGEEAATIRSGSIDGWNISVGRTGRREA